MAKPVRDHEERNRHVKPGVGRRHRDRSHGSKSPYQLTPWQKHRARATVVDGVRYRSKFESTIGADLKVRDPGALYEGPEIPYTEDHLYIPDWVLTNGIIIEAKGWLKPEDRRKLRLVKKQHPKLDIRLVFQKPYQKIARVGGRRFLDAKHNPQIRTAAAWARRNGFQWAAEKVPQSWIDEPPKEES